MLSPNNVLEQTMNFDEKLGSTKSILGNHISSTQEAGIVFEKKRKREKHCPNFIVVSFH